MPFSRAFQWYHSHLYPIWPDGTFNVLKSGYLLSPILPAKISLRLRLNVNFPPVFLVYSLDLVSLRGRTLRESMDSEKVPFSAEKSAFRAEKPTFLGENPDFSASTLSSIICTVYAYVPRRAAFVTCDRASNVNDTKTEVQTFRYRS